MQTTPPSRPFVWLGAAPFLGRLDDVLATATAPDAIVRADTPDRLEVNRG